MKGWAWEHGYRRRISVGGSERSLVLPGERTATSDCVAYGPEGWILFFQPTGLRRACQIAKTTIWSPSTQ